MKKLLAFINELETQLPNKSVVNDAVSKSSVCWQIDHSLIVINGVISQLQKSDPSDYKAEFNFKRWLIFTTNHIPRGKARAPKLVNPEVEATEQELIEKIILAKKNIAIIDTLNRNQFFRHPFFSDLNVKQTKKFLTLHTLHHLKIIRDVVK